MSIPSSFAVEPPRSAQFRENLAQKVIAILLVLSLLPIALIGSITFFRTRQMLSGQVESQLQTIIRNQSQQLTLLSIPGSKALTDLSMQGNLNGALLELFEAPQNAENIARIPSSYFSRYLAGSGNSDFSVFDQMWAIANDGRVLAASDPRWVGEDFSQLEFFQTLKNTDRSMLVYAPQPLYTDETVVFSAQNMKDPSGSPYITLIGAVVSDSPLTTLATTNSFFKSSSTYLFSRGGRVASVTKTGQQLFELKPNPEHSGQLQELVRAGENSAEYTSLENTDVLAYGKWIPELHTGLALEVPQNEIYGEFSELLRFNGLALLGVLAAAAAAAYITARRLILPIGELTAHAKALAEGDLNRRTKVDRRDEIGLLAHTFNTMAGRLNTLYQSLEQKVEERTQQLRSAADIIQLATSSANSEEIFRQTTALLAARFGYLYAGIFTLNETGTAAMVRSEAGILAETNPYAGYSVGLSEQNLVSRAAAHNRPESALSSTAPAEDWPLWNEAAQSEAALPIGVGGALYGVLYLQSARPNAFEAESLTVLKTLSDQIAAGLQKIRLLESTEINLEETSAAYRTSLKITQSTGRSHLIQSLLEGLQDLPLSSALYAVHEGTVQRLEVEGTGEKPREGGLPTFSLPLHELQRHFIDNSLLLLDELHPIGGIRTLITDIKRRGYTSAAVLAVGEGDQLEAILLLASRQGAGLTAARLQPYINLTLVASSTLERLRVTRDLELRLNELEILSSFGTAIANENEPEQIYQLSQEMVSRVIGEGVTFAVALRDEENGEITVPYLSENEIHAAVGPFPLGGGPAARVFESGETVLIQHDFKEDNPLAGGLRESAPPKSWLGVPLTLRGEVMGALILQDAREEYRFDRGDLDFLNTLARQVSASIHNTHLITGLREALQAVEKERFLLNTLLENVPDQIFFKDQDGKYLRVSDSYAAQFDLSPQTLVGKSDLELAIKEEDARTREVEQALLEGESRRLDSTHATRTGEGVETWYQTSKISLRDSTAQPSGILGISRDITGLKRAEETALLRARQLQTAAEIARDTTGTLDLPQFLAQAVNLIRERFGFYHASIFLMDAVEEYAVLRESTGEAGEQLKQAHHQLAVGSQSLVGKATLTRNAVVINDVSRDPNYYPNPFLPETRSELVLPLLVGEQLFGALDVQSTQVDAFLPEDLETLEILADQLAAAVLSANLYTNSQKNLSHQRALQEITAEITTRGSVPELLQSAVNGISQLLPNEQIAFFLLSPRGTLDLQAFASPISAYQPPRIYPVGADSLESPAGPAAVLVKNVASDTRLPAAQENTRSGLVVPIRYNERLLGMLTLESEKVAAFDEGDLELFAGWASTIGAALSNLELLDRMREQAERQRTLHEISSTIHRTVDTRLILETSAAEICKALGARRASIHINPELEMDSRENGHLGQREEVQK